MAQAIWRFVGTCGYQSHYRENLSVSTLVKATIGLPYVPLPRLKEGLKILKEMQTQLDSKHAKFGKTFLSYIHRVWINGDFPPETWNFYRYKKPTTNNFQVHFIDGATLVF